MKPTELIGRTHASYITTRMGHRQLVGLEPPTGTLERPTGSSLTSGRFGGDPLCPSNAFVKPILCLPILLNVVLLSSLSNYKEQIDSWQHGNSWY